MYKRQQKSVFRVVCTSQHAIADDPLRMGALVQGLWNSKAGRAMGDVLGNLDPHQTVVHVHGWTKALSSSVIRAALTRKFKVICTLHDYFSACPNGSFFNYATNTICELQPLSGSCITSQCDRRHYGQSYGGWYAKSCKTASVVSRERFATSLSCHHLANGFSSRFYLRTHTFTTCKILFRCLMKIL